MKLGLHGGLCCGVKTLYNFSYYPLATVNSLKDLPSVNLDRYGKDFNTKDAFFTDEAPSETYKDRLARYLAFCKRVRPQGMLEAILIVGEQTSVWEEILLGHGFKVYVPDWKNSNSGNTLRLYNLIYDEGPDEEDEDEDEDYEEFEDYEDED